MCAICEGAMSRSSPIRARPVVLTRDSPCSVKGRSVHEVCLPIRDHSVSPELELSVKQKLKLVRTGWRGYRGGL
jgi:hypothetical protein